MKSEVGYLKGYGYFIEISNEWNIPINGDSQICMMCGIDLLEYITILKSQFNGKNNNHMNEVFFKNREDAKKALDWVIGTVVMYKLISGGN